MQRDNHLSGPLSGTPEIVLTDREGVYISANGETAVPDHTPVHPTSHRLL